MVIRIAYRVQRDILAGCGGTGGVGVGLRISRVKVPGDDSRVCLRQADGLPGQAAWAASPSKSGGEICPKVGGKASFFSTPDSGAKWIKLREGFRFPKVRPRVNRVGPCWGNWVHSQEAVSGGSVAFYCS